MRYTTLLLFLLAFLNAFTQTVKVKRVVDGDTYVLSTGEKVRMIGIDAPEMSTYFGKDAKKHLKQLIEGETIRIEADVMNQDKDKYGRLLRYTFLNNQDINQKMVCDGYAIAYTRFKFNKKTQYIYCQKTATENKQGMWATKGAHKLFKQKENNDQPTPFTVKEILFYVFILLGSIFVVYLISKLRRFFGS